MALQADGPPDPSDQLLLDKCCCKRMIRKRAIDAYDIVLRKRSSQLPIACCGKGLAALQIGDYLAAERALATALEHDPNSEQARQQLDLVREVLSHRPGVSRTVAGRAHPTRGRGVQRCPQTLTGCAAQQGYSLAAPIRRRPALAPRRRKQCHFQTVEATTPAPSNLQQLYTSGVQKQDGTPGQQADWLSGRSTGRRPQSDDRETAPCLRPSVVLPNGNTPRARTPSGGTARRGRRGLDRQPGRPEHRPPVPHPRAAYRGIAG